MTAATYVLPKKLRTSYGGEATKGRTTKQPEKGAEPYLGLPKRRASDGPPSQWLLLYPLRPSVDTDLIRQELRTFGACKTVRSDDGYYALCEYEAKADAVEAKRRFQHSREPWVLRKEHATGYWAHKAATGLKVDSVSRPKALECLAKLGFPDVVGGWDSYLRMSEKGPRLSDFYRKATAEFYEAEARAQEKVKDVARQPEDLRRRRRVQLGLPDYDSFDEDFDVPAVKHSDRDSHRSQIRSQLGVPDYDSFDEDF